MRLQSTGTQQTNISVVGPTTRPAA